MGELALREFENRALGRRGRRERRVAAFARQRRPAAIAGRNQAGHAEPGAGADEADGGLRATLAATDGDPFVIAQVAQRQGQRGEVVQDAEGGEAQCGAQRLDRELPVVVGHAHGIAIDRIGDGDGRMKHGRRADGGQIGADGRFRGVMRGAGQHLHIRDQARCAFKREAGVGAADVGQQARPVAVRGVHPRATAASEGAGCRTNSTAMPPAIIRPPARRITFSGLPSSQRW